MKKFLGFPFEFSTTFCFKLRCEINNMIIMAYKVQMPFWIAVRGEGSHRASNENFCEI